MTAQRSPVVTTTINDTNTITIYSTTWCGYCTRLKRQLDRQGITYQEINIEQDPASAAYVQNVNGGNQTVPTVRFPDGTALTNPSAAEVAAKLTAAAPAH